MCDTITRMTYNELNVLHSIREMNFQHVQIETKQRQMMINSADDANGNNEWQIDKIDYKILQCTVQERS